MKQNLNKNSNGYKRRKNAITKSTVVMIDMLKNIVKHGIPAKHVLFDSWFSYPSILIEISKIKLKTVARLKKTKKFTINLKVKKERLIKYINLSENVQDDLNICYQ